MIQWWKLKDTHGIGSAQAPAAGSVSGKLRTCKPCLGAFHFFCARCASLQDVSCLRKILKWSAPCAKKMKSSKTRFTCTKLTRIKQIIALTFPDHPRLGHPVIAISQGSQHEILPRNCGRAAHWPSTWGPHAIDWNRTNHNPFCCLEGNREKNKFRMKNLFQTQFRARSFAKLLRNLRWQLYQVRRQQHRHKAYKSV